MLTVNHEEMIFSIKLLLLVNFKTEILNEKYLHNFVSCQSVELIIHVLINNYSLWYH